LRDTESDCLRLGRRLRDTVISLVSGILVTFLILLLALSDTCSQITHVDTRVHVDATLVQYLSEIAVLWIRAGAHRAISRESIHSKSLLRKIIFVIGLVADRPRLSPCARDAVFDTVWKIERLYIEIVSFLAAGQQLNRFEDGGDVQERGDGPLPAVYPTGSGLPVRLGARGNRYGAISRCKLKRSPSIQGLTRYTRPHEHHFAGSCRRDRDLIRGRYRMFGHPNSSWTAPSTISNGSSSTRCDDATSWSASFATSRRKWRKTACRSRTISRNYRVHQIRALSSTSR